MRKKKKSPDLPNLPKEILIEIFKRLPAKSVASYRCLSKTWCTDLSTPDFIHEHATCRSRPENLFLKATWNAIHMTSALINDKVHSQELNWGDSLAEVDGLCSCNGLVLLSNTKLRKPNKDMGVCHMILGNPITKQHVQVPFSPLPNAKKYWRLRFYTGLGYDRRTKDYKIVIACSRTPCKALLDVYSVESDNWKRVNIPMDYANGRQDQYGAFINGALHWVSERKTEDVVPFIVSFRLDKEEFYEIGFPTTVRELSYCAVFVLDGCLCLVDLWSRPIINIWIMKEHGSVDSWTRLSLVANRERCKYPLCFISNKQIVLGIEADSALGIEEDSASVVVVHNLEERTTNYITFDGIPNSFDTGVPFADSLYSPQQRSRVGMSTRRRHSVHFSCKKSTGSQVEQ